MHLVARAHPEAQIPYLSLRLASEGEHGSYGVRGAWLHGVVRAIRPASFTFVRQVTDAVRTSIDAWNDRCVPFAWTKTADQVSHRRQPVIELRNAPLEESVQQRHGLPQDLQPATTDCLHPAG